MERRLVHVTTLSWPIEHVAGDGSIVAMSDGATLALVTDEGAVRGLARRRLSNADIVDAACDFVVERRLTESEPVSPFGSTP